MLFICAAVVDFSVRLSGCVVVALLLFIFSIESLCTLSWLWGFLLHIHQCALQRIVDQNIINSNMNRIHQWWTITTYNNMGDLWCYSYDRVCQQGTWGKLFLVRVVGEGRRFDIIEYFLSRRAHIRGCIKDMLFRKTLDQNEDSIHRIMSDIMMPNLKGSGVSYSLPLPWNIMIPPRAPLTIRRFHRSHQEETSPERRGWRPRTSECRGYWRNL